MAEFGRRLPKIRNQGQSKWWPWGPPFAYKPGDSYGLAEANT